MNKQKLLELLVEKLFQQARSFKSAADDARKAATDDEARAEDQYDTRGLEQSYLAAGHANKIWDINDQISTLKHLGLKSFQNTPVDLTALVEIEENLSSEYFWLLPVCGGEEIDFEGKQIFVLTEKSPLGSVLIGKSKGETVVFANGKMQRKLKISNVW